MGNTLLLFLTLGKIFGLIIAGFLLFQIQVLRNGINLLLKIILNGLFPVYFIRSFGVGWEEAVSSGWVWLTVFFAAGFAIIGVQFLIGRGMVHSLPLFKTGNDKDFIVMTAMHNAGYIPLPIIKALAPESVTIYMFFFFFAFNIVFWSLAVSAIAKGDKKKIAFKINMPLIGLFAGFLVGLTGIYRFVPPAVDTVFFYISETALNGVLVLLGAILATIHLSKIKFMPVFAGFAVVKLVIFPGIVLAVAALIPLDSLSPELTKWIKTTFVLQAAVPPATNLLIAARAYGTKKQEIFFSNGIIHTYAVSIVTLPLFLLLAGAFL